MCEAETSNYLSSVVQIIGVAYTYKPSLAVRRHLLRNTQGDHSSKTRDFSYFYKGNKCSIVTSGQKLSLRVDPATGALARHWPEPELAVLLGERHEIVAYTLANDLTAISIEARGRTTNLDGTYEGKVWERSGSLGPDFISASKIQNPALLDIGLRIVRKGHTIYDQTYNTSRRVRPFLEIPDSIVTAYKSFDAFPPPSKRIQLDPDDFLPEGTVIMLGSGIIVSEKYFCLPGDTLTVYCSAIGELENEID